MELTSHQKVAQVILSLSPKDASQVLHNLTEEELFFVGESILKHAKAIDRENPQAEDIIEAEGEFGRAITKRGQSFLRITVDDFSEFDVVKALYKIAFGEKRAVELIQKLFRRHLVNQLSFLGKYSSQHLFLALRKESTSVISLVLGTLKPKLSAEIIRLFDSEKRRDIIKAISVQQQPMPQAIKAMENVLRIKLNEMVQVEQAHENCDGEHNLYLILDRLAPEVQDEILENLEDKKMKERLEYRLFSWSSLELLHQRDIEKILQRFSNKDLAYLILVDGIDASAILSTIVSENRMKFVEDELVVMQVDLVLLSKEIRKAKEVKRQFFTFIKELSRNIEYA